MNISAIIHPRTHVRRELVRSTVERMTDQLLGLIELRARFERLHMKEDAAWCTRQIAQLEWRRRRVEDLLDPQVQP